MYYLIGPDSVDNSDNSIFLRDCMVYLSMSMSYWVISTCCNILCVLL